MPIKAPTSSSQIARPNSDLHSLISHSVVGTVNNICSASSSIKDGSWVDWGVSLLVSVPVSHSVERISAFAEFYLPHTTIQRTSQPVSRRRHNGMKCQHKNGWMDGMRVRTWITKHGIVAAKFDCEFSHSLGGYLALCRSKATLMFLVSTHNRSPSSRITSVRVRVIAHPPSASR